MEKLPEQMAEGVGEALPLGRVLSYLAISNTPTRVRKLAAIATRCVAGGYGLGMLLILWLVISQAFDWAARAAGPGLSMSLITTAAKWFVDYDIGIVALVSGASLGIVAAMLLIAAGPVHCGKKWGCIVAWWGIFIVFLLLHVAVALQVIAAIISGFGDPHGEGNWVGWLWLLPAVGTLLCAMLLMDVLGFLNWIKRNPVTEKPPVPFMPGK